MLTEFICFLLGVFFAPVLRPLLRPLAVETVKLFITATHEARVAAAKMKEEIDDAVAAAAAERAQTKEPASGPASAESKSTKQENPDPMKP